MDVKKIREIFTDIKKKTRGIRDVLLVSEDGFPIVSTLEAGDEEAKSTAVGAIICEAGQRGVRELNLGEVDLGVTIGTEGFFVMKKLAVGSIMLVVVENDEAAAPLGMVLMRIRNAAPEIMNAYEN